jgi:ribosomal subunit interface protein
MHLTVKGKHLDVGDALREHVREHLTHTTSKYFRDPLNATVIFTKEKNHRYAVDISVHIGRGMVLESHFEGDDPYPTFDEASKRVGARLAKYKDRLRDHHRKDDAEDLHVGSYTTFEANNENSAEGAGEPAVVAEMETQILTLAVSDAVMRLELGDLPALMFKNPATGAYNMVYRRKDGHIGWVDPATQKKTGK